MAQCKQCKNLQNGMKKNKMAIEFYKKEKFDIIEENIEKENNEVELLMSWNRR